MKQLTVDLGPRSYSIYIGQNILTNIDLVRPHLAGSEVMVVSNATVANRYLSSLQLNLKNTPELRSSSYLLPDGEKFKHMASLDGLYAELLDQHFSRKVTLIALGGGVIGDMVGFAAATYQRGVSVIQMPTTLLSQVDSSVGGKTGVNHALGKNMVGAFHQPKAVLIDLNTLKTLPRRELVAGLAEVIKYGLMWDRKFFDWIEINIQALLKLDEAAMTHAISRSCEIKAEVVSQDEKEAGVRALLNLGHTFGHAIEAGLGYGEWLHGEAVGLGMLMAADLSWRLGQIERDVVQRIKALLSLAGLPIEMPIELSVDDYLKFMQVDKKVLNNKMRFVLLNRIGRAHITENEMDKRMLHQTLDYNVPLG